MKKKLKKKSGIMVALTDTAADGVFVELLQYWDGIFSDQKGRNWHPEDTARHLKLRAAIKVLLEFMGK